MNEPVLSCFTTTFFMSAFGLVGCRRGSGNVDVAASMFSTKHMSMSELF